MRKNIEISEIEKVRRDSKEDIKQLTTQLRELFRKRAIALMEIDNKINKSTSRDPLFDFEKERSDREKVKKKTHKVIESIQFNSSFNNKITFSAMFFSFNKN